MAKALTRYFWLFILSISTPTMDRDRFSSHFRRSVDKMCFPSSVCESFLKKCWRASFYLKMAKVLPRFFWSFILSILTIDRVDFPATSFYPSIKFVFLLQSVRVFSKNADVRNFISKWRRPWPDIFWLFILSISTPTMDRGRFSSHYLLSVDKMCFPSPVCESFL